MGGMSKSGSISEGASGIEPGMSAEEFEALRQEWQAELTQVEDEIVTLKQVRIIKSLLTSIYIWTFEIHIFSCTYIE